MRGQNGAGKLDHVLCRAPHKTDADTGAQWAMQQTLDIWTIFKSEPVSMEVSRLQTKINHLHTTTAQLTSSFCEWIRQAGRPAEE